MAITVALPTNGSGQTATNGTSATTGSITFTAGNLYVIGYRLARGGAVPDTVVTVTGDTSTDAWSNIGGRSYNPSAAAQRSRVYGRYYYPGSTHSETLTLAATNSHLNFAWIVAEITGIDTGAAVPYAGNSAAGSADAATSATVALAAFGSASNLSLGVFGSDISGSFTAGGSGAMLANVNVEVENLGMWYYVGDEDPSVTMASADWGGFGIEVAEAAAATGQPTRKRSGGVPGMNGRPSLFGPRIW